MLQSRRLLYNYNKLSFDSTVDKKIQNYRFLNAAQLKKLSNRPTKCKLLARDFIDDSLYNSHYGYFNKTVSILNYESINFNKIKNDSDLQTRLADQSQDREWHTPTELFNPHYGMSIANYIANKYLVHYYPYHDLNIYEIGAGNGTLMLNILDYLKDNHKEIYQRTHYNIIEISTKLSNIQKKLINRHSRNVHIINKSVFDYQTVQHEPCFFIAMEVLDNLAHDVVRYSLETHEPNPYQMVVAVDEEGDFHSLYTPVDDPLIKRYLNLRKNLPSFKPSLWTHSPILRKLRKAIPFSPNLSKEEFLPTKQLMFLDKLSSTFPNHHLIASDFHSLPESIPGINSPVVQTRLNGEMIPVDTFLVQPGYFDIFFPTDFGLLAELYNKVMDRETFFTPRQIKRDVKVLSHKEFVENHAVDINKTMLKDGSNPMLDYYKNASFILS
ncbi:DUF185-domain-containing protein [Wallemia mellicola CBS 633.66]|uniref:Protein arginine methyltransferase NDUFAF7 n=1 Tax=Wallemia mellicola (strain ATCC MYA-4683 / CBS 633.66) TaxID=671144 RepID=I4Y862_WALMC|nr:DUF185-domain-containing protein [Wallemia mellicola CBS 633.66]EIM20154.1 DUF185-domain-containing protein [Wallemia mellicola CBS 633.66]|eukprot:XP_006959875.1 DUF185-domain-containing protein [Wallemia mellicola CBS 633.66]